MTDDRLRPILEQSKALGFLGPGPVEDHRHHAQRFTRVLDGFVADHRTWLEDRIGVQQEPSAGAGDRRLMMADLGAGGGVPTLPMLVAAERVESGVGSAPEPRAAWLSGVSAVLIDASQKRCSFLVWACAQLGLEGRVEVWCGRVEEIAHEDRARFAFDIVVARSFGPPAWTVECGAALLRPGGLLCISEPPERRMWPAEGLARVGLSPCTVAGSDCDGIALFRRTGGVADRFPRRAKRAERDPVFRLGE